MDIELEMQQLKAAMRRNAESGIKSVEASARQTLEWLETNNLDGPYGLYTATLCYMATGEGTTLAFIARLASSPKAFIQQCIRLLDGYYYVIGLDFYRGLPASDDRVYQRLVTKDVQEELARLTTGWDVAYQLFIEQHINGS